MKRWYTYTNEQVWIVQKLTDDMYSPFEIRKYHKDGTVTKEQLDWFDGVTTININLMKELMLE